VSSLDAHLLLVFALSIQVLALALQGLEAPLRLIVAAPQPPEQQLVCVCNVVVSVPAGASCGGTA
jgi:hypothetical protein